MRLTELVLQAVSDVSAAWTGLTTQVQSAGGGVAGRGVDGGIVDFPTAVVAAIFGGPEQLWLRIRPAC
ncbi:hypothetical protein [Mycobacterium lepromatosis]|uniref:hypothetical protein n=1 Tax=Mycobacterium lepromatosis TaxID=480418 RepID=UPI0005F7BD6A|nr:hypothetical protein [Mycobacterium lepromatosis]